MINLQERISLNGTEQFVSIRGASEQLPLLLYLHGGPGDAALPLMRKYNTGLEADFLVVIWEQRGSGRSHYPFAADEPVTIDTFVQDARCLIELLLQRFGKEKVYLVGHSWGSVLGLKLCEQFPCLIHTYIGCGQVVNMQKSCRIAHEFAMRHAAGKVRERLAQIDYGYTGESWLKDLLFTTGQVAKHGGSLYGASNYNRFMWDFIRSKEYSLRDLLVRQKGSLQSVQRLWPELMGVSFEETTAYEVPIVFIEGRQDYHVSSQLAKDYFETITTPKAFYWFEHSAHFPQWCEAERFHQVMRDVYAQAGC